MRDTESLIAWFGGIPVKDRAWLLEQLAPEERLALERCLGADQTNGHSMEWSAAIERLAEAPVWLRDIGIAVLPADVRADLSRRGIGRRYDTAGGASSARPAWSALMTTLLTDGSRTPASPEISEDPGASLFERLLRQFRGARS